MPLNSLELGGFNFSILFSLEQGRNKKIAPLATYYLSEESAFVPSGLGYRDSIP